MVAYVSVFVVRGDTLKSQVDLLQTANSWANIGVLLGGRMRRGYLSKQFSHRVEVRERNVIVNKLTS